MSLQVWLPLNGDLRNQGLSNITVTNNGATVDNNGKIGKCYSFNKTTLYNNNFTWNSLGAWSICYWVKYLTLPSGSNFYQVTLNNTTSSDYTFMVGGYSSNGTTGVFRCNMTGDCGTLEKNIWYHVCATYDSSTSCKLYINGQLLKSFGVSVVSGNKHLTINGRANNSDGTAFAGSSAQCYLNDVRIYDHCLSPKEVKQISQGLILHYKLNEISQTSGVNLVKNGSGELGTQYWSNSNYIYTDVPSDHSELKASVSSNWNNYYMPFNPTHKYKFEVYLKANSTSSTYTYPSLVPYDIDKKRINYYNTKIGFNLGTMTTISQTLNPGDTKIYVTSLANWNANSGHYSNSAAIFGYKDSTGFLYEDGEYTQNTPRFCSGSGEKTNLDKTNNIITLLQPYNGPVVPVGTKVCATADGAAYYYPLGAVTLSSISDWTYKTITVTGNDYLLAARYLQFYAYYYAYYTGIKLTDITLNNNTVYDSSGYGNNGVITGSFSTGDSPKYDSSIYIIDGNDSYITSPTLKLPGDQITMNFWFKTSNKTPKNSYHMPLESINAGYYEISIYKDGQIRCGLYVDNSRYVSNGTSTKMTDGIWHMGTMTYDGATIKRYVDGVSEKDTSITGTLNTSQSFVIGHYGSNTSYATKEACESDVRIYATALSADDVMELYKTSKIIDSQGNKKAREVTI